MQQEEPLKQKCKRHQHKEITILLPTARRTGEEIAIIRREAEEDVFLHRSPRCISNDTDKFTFEQSFGALIAMVARGWVCKT